MDGVILYINRTVIPSPLRTLILDTLLSAKQGVSCMTSRAESSVFWPGITPATANLRSRCQSCNERAPSQPHGPPLAAQEPVYPFQCIWVGYYKYKGCNYMVVVDRYSGWPIVQQSRDGFSGLVKCLREIFITYGIADELSSDGGPEFTAEETQQLLSNCGVHHRLSSVALAHSNGHAELGVKTCKRMLMDNTGPNGEINRDKFQRGMLQYRKTPDRDTGLSPAQMIFGRPIKDFIPILPGSYRPHNTWIETSRVREEAMRPRNVRNAERLIEHTVRLQPLKVGDRVFNQNQTGTHPLRCDRTGLVIEVKQFDQYAVKVDGLGRVTLRNRKFRREFDKIVVDHIPGTPRTIQPLKTLNNAENLSPVNQRTNPEQAQYPPKAKPQTPQPETKLQVLTGAQFTQRPAEANCPIFPPETPAVTIKAPLKFNCPPNESLGDENKPLLDKDIMPHILSAGSPDKESRCCNKRNETGSPNESPLAKTPPDNPRSPPRRSQREKRPPVRPGDYIQL